jgi:hypothetical protein
MNDFADALYTAASLIGRFDVELREIVSLSLDVSLIASFCAFLLGARLGTALAVYRFRAKGALIVIANALLGLPPVVVGLVVYLLLSRSGPLGSFGILFTPTAMVIAQTLLGFPIVIALVQPDDGGRVGSLWGCSFGRWCFAFARHIFSYAHRPGRIAHGLPCGLRPCYRGSRRDHNRWRKYPRLHAHDDNGHRFGDEQGRIELCSCFGHYSYHSVDGDQRVEPFLRGRALIGR